MSSEQNKKRARKSSTTSKDVTSISKKVKNNIESLSTTYNTNNLLNQAMVSVVTSLYANRDIRNFKTATNALDILTKENNIKKFKTKFTNITNMMKKKTERVAKKKKVKDEKIDEQLKDVEEAVFKPEMKTKNKKLNNLLMKSNLKDIILIIMMHGMRELHR